MYTLKIPHLSKTSVFGTLYFQLMLRIPRWSCLWSDSIWKQTLSIYDICFLSSHKDLWTHIFEAILTSWLFSEAFLRRPEPTLVFDIRLGDLYFRGGRNSVQKDVVPSITSSRSWCCSYGCASLCSILIVRPNLYAGVPRYYCHPNFLPPAIILWWY